MSETVADRVEIRSFADRYFDQNCLILQRRDTRRALVVDPGLQVEDVARVVETEALEVGHILITHGHVDHVFGVNAMRELTGARAYMHPDDTEQLDRIPLVTRQFGLPEGSVGRPVIDGELVEGQAVEWQDLYFDVIHTPGHSRGSVVFLLGDRCLGGDTLFRRGVGRTDLPGGDWDSLVTSITGKLFSLPPSTIVYPGHGPLTTIGEEMAENPFVAVSRGL